MSDNTQNNLQNNLQNNFLDEKKYLIIYDNISIRHKFIFDNQDVLNELYDNIVDDQTINQDEK